MDTLLQSPQLFGGLLLVIFLTSFWRPQLFGFVIGSLLSAFFISQIASGYYASTSFFGLEFTPYRKLFGGIVSGLGCLIGLYSHSYFRSVKAEGRFFGILGIFQWSCLLLIFSDHIMTFVTAWELTSVTSFLLIGYKLSSNSAQRGAYQALIITSLGGISLMGALILMAGSLDTWSISQMIQSPGALYSSENLFLIFALLFLGILTKSAQFPFHFWLPDAMQAPTPVSAYLHSATLVKLGVFAAGLFWPIFHHYLPWHLGLSGIGLITFAWGGIGALFQRDLKAGLAYTTFSQLGLILMLFGQRIPEAFYAACCLVIAHALYKSTLFLIVGVIADGSNTQDIRKMSGFAKSKPALCMASILATASMAGLPFFLGFLGKEYALSTLLRPFPSLGPKIFSLSMFSLGVLGTVAFAVFFSWKPFFGKATLKIEKDRPQFSNALTSVVVPLSILSLVFGVFFDPISKLLQAIVPEASLEFFHSNPYLLWISLGMLGGGLVLGTMLIRLKSFWEIDWPEKLSSWRLSAQFQKLCFFFLPWLGLRIKRRFENLSWNYGLIICTALIGLAFIFFLPSLESINISTGFKSTPEMELSFFVSLAGVMALLTSFIRDPGVQIFLAGIVGLCVAFSYAIYGDPDLVLTQVLVEAASLVLMILGYINLKNPGRIPKESWSTQLLHWVSAGTFASAVLLSFIAIDGSGTYKFASRYFFENAESVTHGKNIVNVILVDFRGMDTLVETTVLAIAYFASLALCTRIKNLVRTPPKHPYLTLWMQRLSVVFFWGLSFFSIVLLLRGHNDPGGGFIGGLLFGLAIFVRMLSSGWQSRGLLLTVLGLSLVYMTALVPAFFSQLLTTYYWYGLSSSIVFDAGVFMVVAGSVAGVLEILLKLKARSWAAKAAANA